MSRRAAVVASCLALTVGLGGLGLALAQEGPSPPPPPPAADPDQTAPPATPPAAPAATPSTAAPPAADEATPPPAPVDAADPSLNSRTVVPDEPAPPAPQPRRAAALENTEEADEAPPPKPPEPLKRPRWPAAILQAEDKATAESLRFEAKVGQPVRFKGLTLTVRACETSAADEEVAESAAHLEVQSQPQVVAGRAPLPPKSVFRGWMFAGAPGLHPLEHPLYDVWVIACRTDTPPAPGGKA